MQRPETSNIIIRAIDKELWLKFRAAATMEGKTARAKMFELIREYVEQPRNGQEGG